MIYSVQMVGVGGQGVLLASMAIGGAAMGQGWKVAMSEVHGMAQRGGSVTSTVRIGEEVVSPLIPKGGADLLLGFEPVETYRSLEYANEATYIVTNTHPIFPITVSLGEDQYPDVDLLLERMRSVSRRVLHVDATQLAISVGGAIAANSVLIGAAGAVEDFPIPKHALEEELLKRVPSRHREMNKKAFQMGYEEVCVAIER